MSPWPVLSAAAAAPIVSGSSPNSLLSTIRMRFPPSVTCTISRYVESFAPNCPLSFFVDNGAAPQVPTQCSCDRQVTAENAEAISSNDRTDLCDNRISDILKLSLCLKYVISLAIG